MGCACGGMAKGSDSMRGSYHKHHPVQRTLCRVSKTSPSEAELERDAAMLALAMMLDRAILLQKINSGVSLLLVDEKIECLYH